MINSFPLPLRMNSVFRAVLARSARSRYTGSLLLAASILIRQFLECAKLGCESSLRYSFLHFFTTWRAPKLPENVL